MPQPFPICEVVCLVLKEPGGRILAARRPPGKSLGGLWEFPGGKIDEGETPEIALRREIREELGLELGALYPLSSVTHRYAFAEIRLIPYLSECHEIPDIHFTEHTAHQWIKPEDAGSLDWAPADVPILEELGAARGV